MIDPHSLALVLLSVGCVLGAVAGMDFVRKRRDKGKSEWKQLAKAMRLSRSEQRMLRKLARAAGLPPIAVLISRGCFDHLMRVAPVSTRDRDRAATLREQMFL